MGVHLLTRLCRPHMCCPGLSCVLIFLSVFFFFLCAGQGTFGKVKLAQNTESGIEYAIKILDKSDIKANELTVNVRREVRSGGTRARRKVGQGSSRRPLVSPMGCPVTGVCVVP